MALKFFSFADLLKTGGEGGVGGDKGRKAPASAGLAIPTAENPASPIGLVSGEQRGGPSLGGDVEYHYPCGSPEVLPTDPTIPTPLQVMSFQDADDPRPAGQRAVEVYELAVMDPDAGLAQASAEPGLSLDVPQSDLHAWRELAGAYHFHHFDCPICIAAGRGARYGSRCELGMPMWLAFTETQIDPAQTRSPTTLLEEGII